MPEHQKREMYAVTPVFLLPVLWWSIIVFEAWIARYEAEHGHAEILFSVTAFGRIRLMHVSDRPLPRHTPDLSGATVRALLAAFAPAIVTSAPVHRAGLMERVAALSLLDTPTSRPALMAPG